MRNVILVSACLMLIACHKDSKPAAQTEDPGAPQVATSIDDLDLPTDKSDQITSIDAATGDSSGMPKDGGAVIQAPKPVAAAARAPAEAPAASDSPPIATLPAVPPPPPAVSGSTTTIPGGQ